MKADNAWVLDYCRPAFWPNDFSHPGGDWDEEFEPGTPEHSKRQTEMQWAGFTYVFQTWGRQFGKAMSTLVEVFEPVVQEVSDKLAPVVELLDKLTEEELKQNGTHKVGSINPKINLPVRTFNSGPPPPRFDRRKS